MTRPSLLWALVISTSLGISMTQTVIQSQPEISIQEAATVTLDCTYDTTESNYYLFWYQQLPSGQMIFIIRQESYKQQNTTKDRFSVNFQKAAKSFSLKISDSELRDAAIYFCAFASLTVMQTPKRG
ncbi:T-cell receptor alpha chain V region HPB-MLT [Heterocephalus glaber]|nr:T-cell receptor alpha chain V region HPB-MLT [Heterocephalus glaber]